MKPADFVNEIVVNILKKDISSDKNFEYGGSKNTLRQCIDRNNGLGKKVVMMITNMIQKEIDRDKKKQCIKYIKNFLNENEVEYMKKNPDDIKMAINFISEKMKKSRKKNIESNENYKIVDIPTLLKTGWTIRKYVEEATILSYDEIDGLTEEHNGEIEKQIPIIEEQPENRRILLNNNQIIGMWSFKPFYDEYFQKAKNGELFDIEINPNMMPALLSGGTYNIYFSNILLKKQYRTTKAFKILFQSIIKLIEKWAEEGIYINEICAQAYSTSGKNLCKTAKLKFIKEHIDEGDIYCGYVYNLVEERFCDEFPRVRSLYREFKKKNQKF